MWLDRLIIQKGDGEVSILNLDEYTVVEVLQGAEGVSGESPMTEPAEDRSANLT